MESALAFCVKQSCAGRSRDDPIPMTELIHAFDVGPWGWFMAETCDMLAAFCERLQAQKRARLIHLT